MSKMNSQDYADFFREVKGRIRDRQLQALRSVNRELVGLYWEIGELIHRKQAALGWGKSVVETLARDLQADFPGRNGFSANNLWLMRQFYCEYADKPNLQSMIGEISWTKNLVIFGRCKDDLEREFYLRATARYGWTKAVLQHQVDNKSYEKFLLNQTNFETALPESACGRGRGQRQGMSRSLLIQPPRVENPGLMESNPLKGFDRRRPPSLNQFLQRTSVD